MPVPQSPMGDGKEPEMPREVLTTPAAAAPKASYSQAVHAAGLLFTAGFGPHDATTGNVVEGDIRAQTNQTLDNLEAVLATRGLTFAHLVKVTVHLQDLKRDFAAFDEEYRRRVPAPFPARTTVGSQLWDILVEIDVVAVSDPDR